mmetsp:Transcript_28271/g.27213  ORF Transcript_28271/g.27213 Transcript_28271/m.27213 type:complete len:89 (-) Transcript_28271:531-797(-)
MNFNSTYHNINPIDSVNSPLSHNKSSKMKEGLDLQKIITDSIQRKGLVNVNFSPQVFMLNSSPKSRSAYTSTEKKMKWPNLSGFVSSN